MATMTEVAEHLDVSDETVRQLKKRGVLSAAPRGGMDLDECRVSYIRHLREQAAGRSSEAAEDSGLDLVKERARLASLQADAAEIRNAQLRREWVPVEAVTAAVVGLIEMSKARLVRLPAKVARSDAKLRDVLSDAISEALEDLSAARVEEGLGGDAGDDGEGGDP